MHSKRVTNKRKNVNDNSSYHFEVFSRSVIINNHVTYPAPSGGMRGEIKSFSRKSRERLKFTAGNAFPELISQFCMTYHDYYPQGRQVKKQLNLFLTRLRKLWKCGYLWILEFQIRGVPHFHLFLTLPVDRVGLHEWLAKTWNEIAAPGDSEHLSFHLHEENFISWKMYNPGYLCKYLSKEAQKKVPEHFEEVGRFWGASRGLVPRASVFTPQMIDENYPGKPSKMIKRTILKYNESQCRQYGKKVNKRNKKGRCLITNGAVAFEKCVEYLDKNLDKDIPF